MNEKERRAYLKLLHYGLIEIRHLSSQKSLFHFIKNRKKINNLSDVLHNLPILLHSDRFDEKLIWNQLIDTVPEYIEYFREVYEDELSAYFEFNFALVEPWCELSEEARDVMTRELYKELKDRDSLFFNKFTALARRIDNDDVLFRAKNQDEDEFFVVAHLTWNNTLPSLHIYKSIEEWKIDHMMKTGKSTKY
ncbi:hypothetical protein ACFO9Q_11095 [Paenibacillus sp. GCM10023252]|uniref:hypothetical protein n=1 Tax=Paenibacillus sp. GCM10023252 TaxID=3252649 RepID=UPI003619C20C